MLSSMLIRAARRHGLCASTALAVLFSHAGTERSHAQPIDLPTLVVTPTAIPTPVEQVASSVTVITATEMERDQRRTVPDALRTVPGLNVVQTGGPGGLTSVFMRGTNSNHVKVLIDGIDVSDPSNPNRSFDFGHLLTADIDRIEVVRGPQSGLYGADAIGGVIAIYTKKGEGPPKLTTTIEGGSFGTLNEFATLSGSTSRFNYAFNVAHFRSTDTPVTPLELLPPGRKRINGFYDNLTYSTRLGADVTDNFSVNLVARHTDSKLRFTGDDFSVFPSVPAAAQSTQLVSQNFARGEALWSLFNGAFVNRFGTSFTDHWNLNKAPDTIFGPGVKSINRGDRVKYDWLGTAKPLPGQTLLLGLEQETERLRTDTTAAENGNRAAYVELQSEFAKRFFGVANVRLDDNDSFGSHATYRLAPAVILPATETKLKASYGTGFKAPTLSQLFVDFPAFNFFGNPNLKPEESVGYDVGFEQPFFNDRVRFGATYFHNDISNLITTNDTFTSFINVGRAETQGAEVFATAAVTERLKLRGDYTYTEARDAITGLELLRRPRHKASLTTVWTPIDALVLSATVLHVGSWVDISRDASILRLMAPGYTVVNVAANYTVDENVKLFARIDNLFDLRYQDPTGFLRPGIGVFAGMRLINAAPLPATAFP
jgi:vitamin B12 transporter